jgi:FkbM family methyltransferase
MAAPELLRAAAMPLRLLPAGFGQPRIAHKMHHRWLADETRPRRARVGAAMVTLDLRDLIQAEAYLLGVYERELVRFISRELAHGGSFVDVGANIGLITLPVAAGNRQVRAIAFEPHPGNAAKLRANVAANPGLDVEVREVALGSESGQIYLTSDDAAQTGWFRASRDPHGIPVRMESLDRELSAALRIDVMKLDAEGSEVAILHGAERLLGERRIGCIISEVNPELGIERADLRELLSVFGYREVSPPVPLGRRLRGLVGDVAVFRRGSR